MATANKVEKIIETVDGLTVLELNDLVKALQEKYGVSAVAPMAAAGPAAGAAPAEEVEEQTSFDVVLLGAGEKKIQVIKVVRELTSLGLKEAKDLVESAPQPIKQSVNKEEAEQVKAKLEAEGASVEIK